MKKACSCLWFMVFIALSCFCGCGDADTEHFENQRSTEWKQLDVTDEAPAFTCFAVSDTGVVYAHTAEGVITAYESDGTKSRNYTLPAPATALCINGSCLYAYSEQAGALYRIDTAEGEDVHTVNDRHRCSEVSNLVSTGDAIYLFAVQEGGYAYDRAVFCFAPDTGAVTELPIQDVSAIYASSDGALYYCVSSGSLYAFDTKADSSVLICDLTERFAISALTAFVYERDYFAYSTYETDQILVCSLAEEGVASEGTELVILDGKQLTCALGNVYYYPFLKNDTSRTLNSFYLGDIQLKVTQSTSSETVSAPVLERGSVKVCGLSQYIDATGVKRQSGIRTKFVERQTWTEAFFAELMAGTTEIDIYIFSYGDHVLQTMRDIGLYVPLNESALITGYRDDCFDYVQEAMTNDTGDIWMLPISASASGVWYVPENLEKRGIDLNRFDLMQDFLALSDEHKNDSLYGVYTKYPTLLGLAWLDQYDRTYCDFSNKTANYETDAFHSYFEQMWSGWMCYSQDNAYPAFSKIEPTYGLEHEAKIYQSESVLYKWCSFDEHLSFGGLEGWRVLPTPKFSQDVVGNSISMKCAVINPYSENKELALAYLEAITQQPFSYYQDTVFLFSDKAKYEKTYDISQPAFDDMYQIMRDATLFVGGYPYVMEIIDDYQNGRFSLDEAISELPRATETWLNE